MCLNLGKNWKSQRTQLRNRTEPIIAYKVLCKDKFSPHYRHKWKMRWNVSDRQTTKVTEYREINRGFHFYSNKKEAFKNCYFDEIVWEVEINPKDIVAFGKIGSPLSDTVKSIVATRAKLIRLAK